jgi:hypothetical protein
MRGANGIGEDALPWMKCVGALRRERLGGFASRARFGLGTLDVRQRKIFDRAGPGEFGVLERGEVPRHCGEPRGRHDDKNDMPQGGGNYGAARDAALDPALFEKTPAQKILGNVRSGEDGAQAAPDALVKTSPGELQLRLVARSQAYGSGRLGSLPQEIQCSAGLAQKEFLSFEMPFLCRGGSLDPLI